MQIRKGLQKIVKQWIKNMYGNIEAVFFSLFYFKCIYSTTLLSPIVEVPLCKMFAAAI